MFHDRRDAGRALAERLATRHWAAPVLVVALPRGGVPVAAEVARRLGAPLDLAIVRKIGVPWQPEVAMAALIDGEPPELVVDEAMCASCGIGREELERLARDERPELQRRRRLYLAGRAPLPARGRTVIVVDDGLATGTTARAALRALRRQAPARLVLAVPVAPAETLAALHGEADELVCLQQPSPFRAVGAHYADFHQVPDDEVLAALQAAAPPDQSTRRGC